jgi:hypothetical protein
VKILQGNGEKRAHLDPPAAVALKGTAEEKEAKQYRILIKNYHKKI